MELIKIRDVLTYPEKNPEGWLCLPPDSEEWSLDTLGIFSLTVIEKTIRHDGSGWFLVLLFAQHGQTLMGESP